jgi:hypothetical protein
LASSKAALAAESGASIFDWTGEVEDTCRRAREENPSLTFDELHDEYLHKFEDQVSYAQISPRHIEAAYTRTMQILFEGNYSGLMKPWVHYVPLKKDFSNFKEVQDAVSDKDLFSKLTENAYRDLIHNEALSFKTFLKRLDLTIG